jgi:hypothetical protein
MTMSPYCRIVSAPASVRLSEYLNVPPLVPKMVVVRSVSANVHTARWVLLAATLLNDPVIEHVAVSSAEADECARRMSSRIVQPVMFLAVAPVESVSMSLT